MARIDRRTFVSRFGIGSALAGSVATDAWRTRPHPDLLTIARKLTACSREAVFSVATELMRDGADWKSLLGGTFLAGVREIKPQPVGFQFHAVMMVESAFQLAAASEGDDRLLPVFFNIDDFKRSQARDVQRGDWVMQPRVDRSTLLPEVAQRCLEKAMLDWDAELADRAIASLYASMPMHKLFEILWPLGARDFTNIGHKIIWTTQAFRTLRRIGWKHGLPVMRSLMLGLLDGKGTDPSIAHFEANRQLGRGMPKGWKTGKVNPESSLALLEKLRGAKVADAPALVVEAVGRGAAPKSIFDAYRLLAAEMLMLRPGILAVHPTTAIHAMHFAFRTSRRDPTKRVLLLQGATWLALYRDFLSLRKKLDTPRIEVAAAANSKASPNSILGAATRSKTTAARQVLALPAHQLRAFEKCVRRNVFAKGTEHHMYKYSAAVLEDVRHCHPSLANHLLAAAVHYIPADGRPDAPVHARTKDALAKRK
jgi:hypothetical protein